MPSDASNARALEQRISDAEERKSDFRTLLNLASKYNLNEQFPGLAEHLLSQTEIISHEVADLILSATNPPRKEPAYEVSVTDTAEALGVSEQTIRNWDQSGCPLDPNYPGRFNAVIFYQWAQTFRSLQNFKREARKRAILMNRPA